MGLGWNCKHNNLLAVRPYTISWSHFLCKAGYQAISASWDITMHQYKLKPSRDQCSYSDQEGTFICTMRSVTPTCHYNDTPISL